VLARRLFGQFGSDSQEAVIGLIDQTSRFEPPRLNGIFWDIQQMGEISLAQATVGKWGKNLAIRFPGEIVKAAGLSDGEHVEIETHDGGIVIRRSAPHFNLEDLFAGKSPEQWRAAYAGIFNWGPDVGREIIEE
jgi:antitoxin MazE